MSPRAESRRELKLRRRIVVAMFMVGALVLCWRGLDLQINKREFLQGHGDARYLRVERIATPVTHRERLHLELSTSQMSVQRERRNLNHGWRHSVAVHWHDHFRRRG